MSPWEKRLAQDRKEIFEEVKRMREEAIERLMPELIARLEGQDIHTIDARRPGGTARRANYFPDLLRSFMASADKVWAIIPGDKDDANIFRQRMARVIKQEGAAAHQRREGVLIYLERA